MTKQVQNLLKIVATSNYNLVILRTVPKIYLRMEIWLKIDNPLKPKTGHGYERAKNKETT